MSGLAPKQRREVPERPQLAAAPRTPVTNGETEPMGAGLFNRAAPLLRLASAVQRAQTAPQADPSAEQIHAAARSGVQAPAGALPHAQEIQRAFGRHDVSSVQAHVGAQASASAAAMNAKAYATGDHVVFGGAPDLRTAAHEAAHVVQQRAGVQVPGGVGQAGDRYEQHADRVADRVAAGESAEDLLDKAVGTRGGAAVQRWTRGHSGNSTMRC